MYSVRTRGALCTHLAHQAAASAFLPHSARHAAAAARTHDATCARASHTPCSARAVHSSAAVRSASDSVDVDGPSDASKPRRRSSFKIFKSTGERRRAIEAEQAEQDRQENAAAESAAAIDSTARSLIDEWRTEEAEQAEIAEEEQAGGVGQPTIDLSDSQVRGILAKRAALQAIHPLRMLITSPRHGLDKIRIIPQPLAFRIDTILRAQQYQSGQNDVMQRTNYALWHVANRSVFEFGVLARIFDEVVKRLPSLDPHSVLDYGSATNMTLLALQESLQKYANKDPETGKVERPIRTYRTIENNTDLAKFGTDLSEDTVQDHGIEVKYRAHLPPSSSSSSLLALEQSSVVVAPYSLSLVEHKQKRLDALDTLWASVEPGGVLVLVEAGTIEGFQMVREAREHLLDAYGMRTVAQRVQPGAAATAANVVAPCGSNGVCPMGDRSLKRSCWHRTEMLTSSLPLRTPHKHLRAKAGVTVETFSYLVVHKGPVKTTVRDAERALLKWKPKPKDLQEVGQQGWQAIARQESLELQERIRQQEEKKFDDPDAVPYYPIDDQGNPLYTRGPLDPPVEEIPDLPVEPVVPVTKRSDLTPVAHLLPSATVPANTMFDQSYARILLKPLKRGEHVILDLCNEESKLERRVIPKSYGIPYTLARSVNEDDLWPLRKRQRDPNAPMTVGEKRRAEVKARKEKRAAKLSEMDDEEAEVVRQELNAKKAAEKAERLAAKKERAHARQDADIVARGGTPPDRTPKEPEREHAEQEEVIFLEDGDLDEEGEKHLAKFRVATVPIPQPKEVKTKAALKTKTQAQDDDTLEEFTGESIVDGAASAKSGLKKKEKSKVKGPGPLEIDPSFSKTGGTSRMPSWGTSIMRNTKPAVGGGLDYTGMHLPRVRKNDDLQDDEDDEDGEFEFAPEPTLRNATERLSKVASGDGSFLEVEEARRAARARKEAKRAEREEAEFLLKQQKRTAAAATTTGEKTSREEPKESVADDSNQTNQNTESSQQSPSQRSSDASSARPTPASSVTAPIIDVPTPIAAPAAAVASTRVREEASFDGLSPAAAASSFTASFLGSASSPGGRWLPKWAKFRTIKDTSSTPATAENTASWPAGSKDAPRNLAAAAGFDTEAEWEAMMARHRAEQAEANGEEPKKVLTPSQLSFFKREEARRRKTVASAKAAESSTSQTKSSLPAHLARLKESAMRSPANARYLATGERAREFRDAYEARARQSHNRDRGGRAGDRDRRDQRGFKARSSHGRGPQRSSSGLAKRPRY